VSGRSPLADVHCHLVPGVDDGAPSVEVALHWLRDFVGKGVTRVAATPHLPASAAGSPYRRRVERAFERLAEEAARELPDLELSLAYEIRLDGAELPTEDEGLWLGPGGHLLVEYDMFTLPADPLSPLRPLLEAGRVPVLAHPERYLGGEIDPDLFGALRASGVRTCVNAGSLWGRYGERARGLALRMLQRGQMDLIASDHHAREGRSDDLGKAGTWLRRHAHPDEPGGGEAIARLLSANPLAVLEGRPVEEVPPLRLVDVPESGFAAASGSGRRGRRKGRERIPTWSAGGAA